MPLSPNDARWLSDWFNYLRRIIMTSAQITQSDLDNIKTELDNFAASLTDSDSEILAEIATLKESHPDLDLSGVETAVANLSGRVDAIKAIVPVPSPVPTPDPGVTPSTDPAQPTDAGGGSTGPTV